jgi:hypothetical protein
MAADGRWLGVAAAKATCDGGVGEMRSDMHCSFRRLMVCNEERCLERTRPGGV